MDGLVQRMMQMTVRQRIVGALGLAALLVTLGTMVRLATQDAMQLLYAGLDPAAAGEVVTRLDAQATAYEVRGDSIFVPSSVRDSLRLSLAAEGLPRNAAQGYELLDSLSGFGTTAQMFDAAYWRAKEGELARTLMSAPDVREARVHIAHSDTGLFRDGALPSASVTILSARAIDAERARAIRFLVASAVTRLTPEAVSVIDAGSGRVIEIEDRLSPGAETDRADRLRQRLERLLEARVGRGNAVVEVSIETVTETEAILERRIDPDSRVAISQENEERASRSTDSGEGQVTVASNLPDGDAAGGDSSESSDSETRELVNYDVSETTREVTRLPGAIKRLSIAVLVNGVEVVDPAGGASTWTARPDEELAALRSLVASASGFDPGRGDQITVDSMQFTPAPDIPATAEPGMFAQAELDATALVQFVILGAVALIVGLFVIRPLLQTSGAGLPPVLPEQATPSLGAVMPDRVTQLPSPQRAPDGAGASQIIAAAKDDAAGPESYRDQTDEPGITTHVTPTGAVAEPIESPVDRLRRLIEERREDSIEVLRGWMEADEEAT